MSSCKEEKLSQSMSLDLVIENCSDWELCLKFSSIKTLNRSHSILKTDTLNFHPSYYSCDLWESVPNAFPSFVHGYLFSIQNKKGFSSPFWFLYKWTSREEKSMSIIAKKSRWKVDKRASLLSNSACGAVIWVLECCFYRKKSIPLCFTSIGTK